VEPQIRNPDEFVRIESPMGEMRNPLDFKVRLAYVDGRVKGIVVPAENPDEARSYARLHNLMTDGARLLAREGVVVVD